MRKWIVLCLVTLGCSGAGGGGAGGDSGGGAATGGAPGAGGNSGRGGSVPAGTGGGIIASGGAGGTPATGGGGNGSSTGNGGTTGNGGVIGTGGSADAGGVGDTGGGTPDAVVPPLQVNAFVYASGAEFGGRLLTAFQLDPLSGMLTRKGTGTAGGNEPDYLAIHPNGKFLYVNNENPTGQATAFSIATDGTLTMLNNASSGGGGPAHNSVHKSGKWLLSANYNDGKLGIIAIGDDGRLGAVHSANAGGQAHMAIDDGASGNFVFVPCKAAGYVKMFKFDIATGMATPNAPDTIGISSARHMAFHPNGKFAYVTQEAAAAMVALNYDAATGLLSNPKSVAVPIDGTHVVVHPSGTFVFHIARSGAALTTFKVAGDGTLSKASSVPEGANDATITQDGRYLITVSGTSVRTFAVNQTTGALTAAGTGQAVNTAQSVAVTIR